MEFPDNRTKEAPEAPKKEEEKLPEPIIEHEVKKKKQTALDRAKRRFFKEDAKSVLAYIFGDILVPALTNTFVSMVQNGVDYWVNGNAGGPRRRNREYRDDRVNYVPYSGSYRDEDYRGSRRRATPTYSYDEVIFDSRADAEAVLMRLRERIYETGAASIAYLYSLVRWSSDYTANAYGWINLDQASIVRLGGENGGFLLKLPRPVEI